MTHHVTGAGVADPPPDEYQTAWTGITRSRRREHDSA